MSYMHVFSLRPTSLPSIMMILFCTSDLMLIALSSWSESKHECTMLVCLLHNPCRKHRQAIWGGYTFQSHIWWTCHPLWSYWRGDFWLVFFPPSQILFFEDYEIPLILSLLATTLKNHHPLNTWDWSSSYTRISRTSKADKKFHCDTTGCNRTLVSQCAIRFFPEL